MSTKDLANYLVKSIIPELKDETSKYRSKRQDSSIHDLYLSKNILNLLINDIDKELRTNYGSKVADSFLSYKSTIEKNFRSITKPKSGWELKNINFTKIGEIRDYLLTDGTNGFLYGTKIKIGSIIHRGHTESYVTEKFRIASTTFNTLIGKNNLTEEQLGILKLELKENFSISDEILNNITVDNINNLKVGLSTINHINRLSRELNSSLKKLVDKDAEGLPRELKVYLRKQNKTDPLSTTISLEIARGDEGNLSKGSKTLAEKNNFFRRVEQIVLKKFEKDILNLSGSKTLKQASKDYIIGRLTNKKTTYKGSSSTSTNIKTGRTKLPDVSLKTPNNKKARILPIKNLKGQFMGLTKLEVLLNAGLLETIKKNMQRPNLRNQTGRFAKSVKLESLSRSREGAINAFLTYMRYPYATFEKDGKQGHKGYYPSRLIDQSVRELASKLVRERMRVVVQ